MFVKRVNSKNPLFDHFQYQILEVGANVLDLVHTDFGEAGFDVTFNFLDDHGRDTWVYPLKEMKYL